MDYFRGARSLDLEPDAELEEVQAPIQRPDAVQRPGLGYDPRPRVPSGRSPAPQGPRRTFAPSQRLDQPAPQQAPEQVPLDYFRGARELDAGNVPGAAQPEPAPKDDRSLARRAVDYVKGREDPQYKGTKTFTMDDADDVRFADGTETSAGRNWNFRLGRVVAGSDEAYADVIKKSLGSRFKRMEKDSQGSMIVVFDGEDGPETKRYVNEPGLSAYDVERGAAQALPYVLESTAIGKGLKGAGALLRAIGQFGGAGGTSLVNDAAAWLFGSEQGLDPAKAAVIGTFGAAGEFAAPALSYAWRKVITEPRLFNRTAGKLTEKGEEAARAAGLDPSEMTSELGQAFAKVYAQTGNKTLSRSSVTTGEFYIPVTQGQRAKDPARLLNEKAMRYGVHGEGAKTMMREFDERQAQAVREAAFGSTRDGGLRPDGTPYGVAPRLAPGRPVNPNSTPRPGEMGEAIRSGVQGARGAAEAGETQAWGQVADLVPQPQAFDTLPDLIAGRIGSLRIDNRITPKAYAMAEDLQGFIDGKAIVDPAAPALLKQTPVRTVDEMRRRLLGTYKGASDATDRAAAKAVYDGFNDWIDDAAGKALLSGDAQAAANLRLARDTTKQMKNIFGERDVTGKATPGRRILADVLDKADSPESIIAKLFGSQGFDGAPKQGSIEALDLIKRGLTRYADKDAASAVWNDIRLAHWARLVQDKQGNLYTPTMLAKNIDSAMRSQHTVMARLYSPEELRTIRSFARAMKEISYKDPNPSGSGTAVAFYGGQFGQALLSLFGMESGPISRILQTILRATPLKNAPGETAARAATSQALPTVRPILAPYTAPIGAQLERR